MTFEETFKSVGNQLEKKYENTAVISMTARVGSTAFVSALNTAGLFHSPIKEIFNPRHAMKTIIGDDNPASLIDYLNRYYAEDPSGILAFKTNWIDFAPALNFVGDEFDAVFPNAKFVHIERKDKVAQAYSLWKANEYNVWHREKGAEYKNPVVGRVPLDPIKRNLINLQSEERKWAEFFDSNEIKPHRVWFEDIVDDLPKITTDAFIYLTGRKPNIAPASSMSRSSDDQDAMNVLDLHERLMNEAMSSENPNNSKPH